MKRRKFLGISALIGASTYLLPNTLLSNPVKRSKLKLGFIGTGLRGQGMMRLATYRNDVDIPVICDIDDEMISKALKVLIDLYLKYIIMEMKIFKICWRMKI